MVAAVATTAAVEAIRINWLFFIFESSLNIFKAKSNSTLILLFGT
jgi:hypothetical protein